MAGKMFEGLKVADFTAVIAGTLITKTLASYGAEVVRIEGRIHPDLFRRPTQMKDDVYDRVYVPWLNRGPNFAQWNTGKMSVALNLSHPKGKEIARKFVARADIVVENFAGGVMEKMGLGYNELKKVRPDIIMLSSCMQGQTGPHSNHPGYGTQLVNLAGLGHISGWPDREPSAIGPYTDYVAPRFSLLAIMAALDYRRRTGKGQYIDLSQYECAVQFMTPLLLDYEVNGRIADRVGNFSPYSAPHGVYPCKGRHTDDRWCLIAVYTDDEWERFCKVIGDPPWTRDPRYSTLRARREHAAEVDALVESWTSTLLPEDVEKRLLEVEIWARQADSRRELADHVMSAGNRSPYAVPHGVYRCRSEDRWCSIAVSSDDEWRSFCGVIGNPGWTTDSRFSTLQSRLQHTDELDSLVARWTIQHTAEEVMTALQAVGVPAGILQTGEDLIEKDPQLGHRRFYRKIRQPELGEFHIAAPSFIMSGYDVEITRAPMTGEHNEYALSNLLGIPDDEIAALIREGVLE
jgi:benzylsuccinate CoA-transferase BbsF subunit